MHFTINSRSSKLCWNNTEHFVLCAILVYILNDIKIPFSQYYKHNYPQTGLPAKQQVKTEFSSL